MSEHGLTGFELTKNVLHNLKHFELKNTTKLVLWVLTDCHNPENGSVVFPSIQFIAETADISLTAAKEGIKELINKGLIIKSKRGKVKGNYNKYLLTPKVQNSTSERAEIGCFKKSKNDCFMITNKKRTNKQQNVVKIFPQKDEQYLVEYAKSQSARSVVSYINGVKRRGGAEAVINDFKIAENNRKFMINEVKRIQKELEYARENRAVVPDGWFKEMRERAKAGAILAGQ